MFFLPQFVVTSIILLIGCYTDLKHRAASNLLWFALGAFGLVLNWSEWKISALYSFIMISIVSVLLWRYNLVGGADVKCMILLCFVYPYNLAFLLYVIVVACCISLYTMLLKKSWVSSMPFLFSMFSSYVVCSAYFVLL